MMNGLGLMWSEKAKPLNPEAFCWAARTDGAEQADRQYESDESPSDHLVRVLAAQINQDGYFNIDSVLKRYEEWTGQPTAVDEAKSNGEQR